MSTRVDGTTAGHNGTGVRHHVLGGNQVARQLPGFIRRVLGRRLSTTRNELGTNGPIHPDNDNLPLTGCEHDGTESFTSGDSRALGSVDGNVRVGRPNVFGQGPIRSSRIVGLSNLQPMYGLSQVFEVAVTDSGKPATPAAPSIGATEGSNRSLDVGWLEPAHAGPSVKYYLRYREVTYEPWSNGPQDVTITFANITTGLRAGAKLRSTSARQQRATATASGHHQERDRPTRAFGRMSPQTSTPAPMGKTGST